MLSGKKLGDAIGAAIKLKCVSKTAVAAHFGIKPPSVHDWIKYGRVDKRHIDELVLYFSDVVPPSHWGISAAANTPTDDALPLSTEARKLITLITETDRSASVTSNTWDHIANLVKDLVAARDPRSVPIPKKFQKHPGKP